LFKRFAYLIFFYIYLSKTILKGNLFVLITYELCELAESLDMLLAFTENIAQYDLHNVTIGLLANSESNAYLVLVICLLCFIRLCFWN
jgi:hypothetical protein